MSTNSEFLPIVLTPKQRAWVTFGLMLGMFLAALEATVVGTAMPTVISTLGGLELYSWVYSIYFLSMTVTVPLWGRLSDFYGRKPFYLAGIALFVGGSVLSGFSNSIVELIIWRGIQGTGAGALLPLGLTIVGDMYTLERRAKIQGFFSGVWGFSSLIGPLVGGLLTDYLNWRWVFFINVPFGIVAGIIILSHLDDPKHGKSRDMDLRSALLLVVALGALLLGLDRFGTTGLDGLAAGLSVAGILLLLWFFWMERHSEDPIVPVDLFRDRIFSTSAFAGLFSGMALFGAISFIPLFVQGSRGTAATGAGIALTPLTMGWVVMSVIAARVVLRIGYRLVILGGLVALSAGFLGLALRAASLTGAELLTFMLLIGCGMGVSSISMLLAVQSRFPRNLLGIATSGLQFFRTVGAAIGVAIMGSALARALLRRTVELQAQGAPSKLLEIARSPERIVNPILRASLPSDSIPILQNLLAQAMGAVFWAGLLMSMCAFAAAWFFPGGSAQSHSRRP